MDGRSAANLITHEINKAVEETKHITINANLSTSALQSISAFSQALAESEKAVLEAHAEKQKSLLQKHHYEFCNMLDKKQGVWLSPTMCKGEYYHPNKSFIICLITSTFTDEKSDLS